MKIIVNRLNGNKKSLLSFFNFLAKCFFECYFLNAFKIESKLRKLFLMQNKIFKY